MQSQAYLVLAHPSLAKSRANAALLRAVSSLMAVKVRHLDSSYPDYNIDVQKEQAACAASDLVILQHPFYWYAPPPMLKQWLDKVLAFGWAHGPDGIALKHKIILQVITTGSEAEAYQASGRKKFTLNEFNRPVSESLKMCSDLVLPPFVVHGINCGLTDQDLEAHALSYARLVEHLLGSNFDFSRLSEYAHINDGAQLQLGLGA